jgi:hypothetical protein
MSKIPQVDGARLAEMMRKPAIVALLWFAALTKFVRAIANLPAAASRLDFTNYYDSALAMRHGLNPYTINLTAIGDRLGLHTGPLIHASETPTFLLLFGSLTRLTPEAAFWLWTGLNLAMLGGAMFLLLVRRPGIASDTAWLLGALILAFHPVAWNFFWGQSAVMTLFLLVLAMRAMESDHDAAAGLLIAIAGLLRAFPFLLLGYFLLRRQWRALRFAIGGAIVGAIFTVLMVGFARCLSFVHGALYVANHDRMIFPFVLSLAPFVSRMVWSLGFTSEAVRIAAVLTATALLFSVTIRTTIQSASKPDADFRIFSLWIVSSVILSPVAWHHYLVLLIFPSVQIVAAAGLGRGSRRAIWIAAASYALGSISQILDYQLLTQPTSFQLLHPSISAPILETGFYTLLMAFIAAYWFSVDSTTSPPSLDEEQAVEAYQASLAHAG